MTTVENKLEVFSKNIMQKVEKDCDQELAQFGAINNELLEKEKQKAINEALVIVENMKKKAESEKNQMISKAIIEKEYALLIKKKGIFDTVIDDMSKMAVEYTLKPQYKDFLESYISKGLSQINSDEVIVFFTHADIDKYRVAIKIYINKTQNAHKNIDIEGMNADILGGCIVENKERTIRIDCSMASLIHDSREQIGKILMDNL